MSFWVKNMSFGVKRDSKILVFYELFLRLFTSWDPLSQISYNRAEITKGIEKKTKL